MSSPGKATGSKDGTVRSESGRAVRRRGVVRDLAGGLVHGDEGRGGDPLQLVEQGVRPAGVAGSLEVPVGAVVGEDQAVVLHGPQDHPRVPAEPLEAEARLQPEPRAHGRVAGAVRSLASWRAGHRCAPRVSSAVNLIAWPMNPALTSSNRTNPGRMGRPAASPEVHPFGRRWFAPRSNTAPLPALGWPPFQYARYSS